MSDVTVVFFDIDGTLVDIKGAGRRSFALALDHVFGWKDSIDYLSFAGSTDLQILLRIMDDKKTKLSTKDVVRFFERLPIELEACVKDAELVIYPGVSELLDRLSQDPRVVLGLVTGNASACAKIKLNHFNLHGHFVLGAFGHEHADRAEIACLALSRAMKQLKPGQYLKSRFLVGDTPSDISAAHVIGACAIAVATGKYNMATLKKAGAEHVLRDLSNTEAVLKIMELDKKFL